MTTAAAEVEESVASRSRLKQVGGEYDLCFLKLARSLVLSLLRLSGNRLAEESPPGTPDAGSEGFVHFSDPANTGERS